MGWFDEEFKLLKKKMKWDFKDLDYPEESKVLEKPLVNFKEGVKSIRVKFKLPGINKKDISFKITPSYIELNAFRSKLVKKKSIKLKKSSVKIYRKISFPVKVENKKAKVVYQKGLVLVEIPKKKN